MLSVLFRRDVAAVQVALELQQLERRDQLLGQRAAVMPSIGHEHLRGDLRCTVYGPPSYALAPPLCKSTVHFGPRLGAGPARRNPSRPARDVRFPDFSRPRTARSP